MGSRRARKTGLVTMRQRILNIAIAFDSLLLCLLTFGKAWPGETISSAAYRAELFRMPFRHARPVIDWILCWLEDDHCHKAWLYATAKRNLPEDMR
jgi:hypothetical protein